MTENKPEPNVDAADETETAAAAAPAPPVIPEANGHATDVLRAEDTVLQAHLARQANWEHESARFFRKKTHEELERAALLDELEVIKGRAEEERNKLRAEADKREAIAKGEALVAEAKELRLKAKELETEARRLAASVK